MRISVLALSALGLLTSCSSPEPEQVQEDVTTIQTPETERETISGPVSMIANAKNHLDNLADYIQSSGGDIKRVFNELNNQSVPAENAMTLNFTQEILSENGTFTCISDSKVSVDTEPSKLGKDVRKLSSHTKFVQALIGQLRKTPESEVITTYATLPTSIKDPKNSKKMLSQKHLVVAYGRSALLGHELDKQHHEKFFCYVAYPLNS